MAKNSVEAYGAEGKTNLLMFDPDVLQIVTEPAHPFFDRRAMLPLSEAMILNVMHQGVIQPIVVGKDTETGATCVLAGRQRVKAAREANKRLKAQGLPPIQVPATIRRATNALTALSLMISENELREADTPVGRAEKMAQMIDRGADNDQIATVFGCTVQTVKNTLALLDCTVSLRNAVESGKLGISTAQKLYKLAPDEQRAKVEEILAAGAGSVGHEKARKVREAVGDTVPKMRTRREITAMIARTDSNAHAALEWVLGATDEWFAK